MSKTTTVLNVKFDEDTPIPASGAWQFSAWPLAPYRRPQPQAILRDASIAVVLAISPVTFGFDPWFADRKARASVSVGAPFRQAERRAITILQARQMALEVLARAELERSQFAEAEARRGIDWEQQS